MTPSQFIRLLFAIPLLLWLPGALAWRALGNDVRLDRSERLLAEIVTSLCLMTFLATFLAELSVFSLASLVTGLAILCLALWWVRWRLQTRDRRPEVHFRVPDLQSLISGLYRPLSPWVVGLAAILVPAAALFFRPAEALLVMDDAGVYVIHGLTLARWGGLAVRDPLLPSLLLPPGDAAQLFRFLPYEASFLRLEGFYIWNWGRGLVQPSFFHLPSIWMGILALVGGPRAALWATPLAGLVSITAMAFLSRRLFGPAVGLAAAFLLTVSFPQVWYARYPTSEMFAQAWLLGGLLLLAAFLQHRSPFVGIMAGVSLGQLLLARVDGWIAALGIGICFAGWALRDHHALPLERRGAGDRWVLLPLALTLAWAGLHAALFATPYVVSLMHLYLTPRLAAIAVLGTAAMVLAAVVIWNRPEAIRIGMFRIPTPGAPAWLAGLLVVGTWAVVAAVGTRAPVGSEAIRWLGWYFTPLGLAAALIGAALMIRHGIHRPALPVLLIGLLYALLYLPAPRANPAQPWGVRRFVPTVLPALALMMAYCAVRLPMPGPGRLRQVVQASLVLILAMALARSVLPALAHDEYAGAWDQVEALAGHFEPGAVVLFNQTGVGQAVAQPLTYLHDRPAFVLQPERPDPRLIDRLAARWIADDRPAYLAITGLAPWLADLDVGLEPAGDFTFRFPRLERSMTHAPRETYTVVWGIDLYRLVPGGERAPLTRLDMGPGELPYLQQGFYERETTPDGTTFRWTDGAAAIWLPAAQDVTHVTLRVTGPPAGIPRPTLTLLIDGEQAGTWKLPDRFVTLSADVPAGATTDGRLDIELRSDTWVPRQAGRGDDDRRLGIVVDWVQLTSVNLPSSHVFPRVPAYQGLGGAQGSSGEPSLL